jgi:tetratricopeptide (TPR) repeat protein
MTEWGKFETDKEMKERLHTIRKEYRAVIDAVDQGAPNVTGIKVAARGWLAHSYSLILPAYRLIELKEADFGGALRVYLKLRNEGEGMGENSAYFLIRSLAGDIESQQECARACVEDKDLRKLMTIFLCAAGNRAIANEIDETTLWADRWLYALSEAKIDPSEDATRIALLQYSTGKYTECEQTLKLCTADDPAAALLRSRILLRKGKRTEAIAALRAAEKSLPNQPTRANWNDTSRYTYIDRYSADSSGGKVRADLALFSLSQGEYSEAFRLNALSGLERDMLYVGECVLTIDELKAVVDHDWKTQIEIPTGEYAPFNMANAVRSLLARRLCRAQKWSEALPYLPDVSASALREHTRLMAIAADPNANTQTKADAYWKSAVVMQQHGEALIFCDFGESWSSTGGWWLREWPACRLLGSEEVPWSYLAPPSADEVKRVESWIETNLNPPYRGHRVMKYETMRLGLQAVALLPDNDPAGGKILQCIGSQLMYLDPPAANTAYKLLATRFKDTPFGKHAEEKHWFMRLEEPLAPNPDWVITAEKTATPTAESKK